jgi:hypothetical protein
VDLQLNGNLDDDIGRVRVGSAPVPVDPVAAAVLEELRTRVDLRDASVVVLASTADLRTVLTRASAPTTRTAWPSSPCASVPSYRP